MDPFESCDAEVEYYTNKINCFYSEEYFLGHPRGDTLKMSKEEYREYREDIITYNDFKRISNRKFKSIIELKPRHKKMIINKIKECVPFCIIEIVDTGIMMIIPKKRVIDDVTRISIMNSIVDIDVFVKRRAINLSYEYKNNTNGTVTFELCFS